MTRSSLSICNQQIQDARRKNVNNNARFTGIRSLCYDHKGERVLSTEYDSNIVTIYDTCEFSFDIS